MKKLTYLLLCLFISIGVATAQTTRVTGTVISADDNEPVIGASIIVKGTTIGVVTSFDGTFTLDVPQNAKTLQISYIGMVSQEVAVQPNIRVVMRTDSQNLDEVVVTAMGISRERKSLGYAVQDVKADQLMQGASSTLSGALQGKVSGLEITPSSGMPGASAKMTIRGSRSFTGNNTPLYVVDGMPIASTADRNTDSSVSGEDFTNRALDLDPNDIESVNVLKGQAASALYGVRASNGVIIITTKRGTNARKGKPQISFTSNFSIDELARKPDVQTTYAQGSGGVYAPSGAASWGPKITDLPDDPTYGGNNHGHPGKYYVPQLAAGLGVTMSDPDAWVTPGIYDNIGDFFKTGTNFSNSFNIQQGHEKGSYSFSLGNTMTNGIVPHTNMNRYTAKLAADTQLHPNWTTGFTGNYTYSKVRKSPGANDGIVATVFNAPPSYDLKGIPIHEYGNPYQQTNYRGSSSFGNAYWLTANNIFEEATQRFFGNAYGNYKTNFSTTNHTLNVKYVLGIDGYQNNLSSLWAYGHKDARGSLINRGYTRKTVNSILTAAYSWNINEDLVFDAVLGNELIDGSLKFYQQEGTNFNYSGFNHMSNLETYVSTEQRSRERTVGFFGNLSLAWKNQLYLNVTGRQDYVSTLPPGNHGFFYPSVSLGWIFTELEPLKNNILTYGKLRASYAEVGQPGNFYPLYYSKGSYSGGFISGVSILYPVGGQIGYHKSSSVYDPNLEPQNTKSYELGADLTFLNGLFSLNYTYSDQSVKGQIFSVPMPRSTGVSSYYTNAGHMVSRTHEATLTVNPIRTRNIDWEFTVNFTKNNPFVKELADNVENIQLGGFTTPNVRAQIGEKFPVVWGTVFQRDEHGNMALDDNNRPISGGDGVAARVSPDFNLAFNTRLTIYKFRIAATLDWQQGGQMYVGTYAIMDQNGLLKGTAAERDAGQKVVRGVKVTGYDAENNPIYSAPEDYVISGTKDIQAFYSSYYSISEGMCFDRSFLKLREISIAYPVYEKNDLAVTLSAYARNITLWSELDGFDPETSQGNNNMSGAFERYSLPQTKSFGFGVNLRF